MYELPSEYWNLPLLTIFYILSWYRLFESHSMRVIKKLHMAMLEEWALKKSQPSRGCKAKKPTKLNEAGSPTQPSQASKPKKQDKGNVFPENLENPVNKTGIYL